MTHKLVQVSLGYDGSHYPALADTSERWNGFLAAPRFDRATVERIAADFDADPNSAKLTIDDDGVWAWWDEYADEYPDPRGELYEWDADGRVALGAYGWTWCEEE